MNNCISCKKELTERNWHKYKKDRNHYICMVCSKIKNARYYNDNFKIIREKNSNKSKVEYGSKKWAIQTLGSYRYRDKSKNKLTICDITTEEFLELIKKNCHYCGDFNSKKSLDRLDNSKGHSKNNIVVACRECNEARMDNFTFEEMKILGETIAEIKALRNL